MSYVRVKEQTFGNPMKSIVAFPDHYVNIVVSMQATDATTRDGVKVIPAGTCVKFGEDKSTATPIGNATEKFDAVVFADAEVADGETKVNVTVLVHGFVRKGAIVKVKTSSTESTLTIPTSANNMIMVI